MTTIPATRSQEKMSPSSLRRFLAFRMFMIATIPIVAAAVYYGWTASRRARRVAEDRLQEASQVCAQYVSDYFILHRQAVVAVAGVIERTGLLEQANLNHWLAETRATYGGLLTMLVADRSGRLVAVSPETKPDGTSGSLLGQSVADREYFTQTLLTGRPFVSGVFRGRGFGQDPIVAVAAPIRDRQGAVVGVVEGSLRLGSFEVLLSKFATLPSGDFLLLDQEHRVVFSSMPAWFPVLSRQTDDALSQALSGTARAAVFPYRAHSRDQKEERSWIVGAAEARIGEQGLPWTVLVFQDMNESLREPRRFLYLMGASLVALLIGSALFGRIVSSTTVRPIEELAHYARSIATGQSAQPPRANVKIAEIANLQADFQSMLIRQQEATRLLEENLAERERINRELQTAKRALEQSHAELELAVKERTAQLSLIYNAVTEPLLLYRVEGETGDYRLVSFNEAYRKTVEGISTLPDPGKLIGCTFEEVVSLIAPEEPERMREIRRQLDAAVQSGRPQIFKDATRSVKGERLFYERVDLPVVEEDGRCSHVLRMSRDVTQQRLAEEALHQSVQSQLALHTISTVLRDTPDLEIALQKVVAEVQRSTGFEYVAIEHADMGRQCLQIWAHSGLPLAPGQAAPVVPFDQTLSGVVVRTNRLQAVDQPNSRPEHAAPFYRALAIKTYLGVPIAPHAAVWGVVSLRSPRSVPIEDSLVKWTESLGQQISQVLRRRIAEDDLRESEQRLELAVQATGLGTLDLLVKTRALHCSAVARRHLGLPAEGAVDWSAVQARIHPEDLSAARARIAQILRESPAEDFTLVVRLLGGSAGETRWIQVHGRVQRLGQGSPARIVATTLDITEQRSANQELQRLYEQTRLDAQTRADLLKEVNHRVTNNLSSILGLLITEEKGVGDHSRGTVATTLQNLQQRIRGLLAVHRLLAASQWAPVNLAVLAERIINDATAAAPRGVEIQLMVAPTAREMSPRQAHNLALVLNELATNSVKYGLRAGRPIHLSVAAAETPDGFELIYRDNGPGYPADVLQQQRRGVGIALINQLARESLRGELLLSNEDGAVARVRIKTEASNRT